MGLSFPPFKTWFLIYPGLILFIHLILSQQRYKDVLKVSFVTLIILNIITLYWISSWGSDDLFIKVGGLLTILVHPFFFLLPLLFFYFIFRTLSVNWALISFPVLWTGNEYFHSIGQLAYPWIEFGNTESYNLTRIQYAELFGVHGITFYICILACLVYYTFFIAEGRKLYLKIIILLIFLLPYFYSVPVYINSSSHYNTTTDESKKISASIVQTNIDPWKKWSESVSAIVGRHMNDITAASQQQPDLVVLHETAIPYYFFSEYFIDETNKFIEFSDFNNQNLLLGIPHMEVYADSNTAPETSKMSRDGKRYDTYNSAVLVEPMKDRDSFQIYTKTKLVPFSERTPYHEYLPFMKDFVKWSVGLSSWAIGRGPLLFTMKENITGKDIKFGTVICFESAFSEYVSEFTAIGAQFLVIITNDGWFGNSSGPVQHEQFSVLRAIENRKWIVRAAQTGISCYIDPAGNIYDETEFNTHAILNREIIANEEVTFYAANGDIIGKAGMYLSIPAFFILLLYHVYIRKTKSIA